jgi:hypothetical protein
MGTNLGMSFDLLNIILFPRPFAFIHTSSDSFINLLIRLFFFTMRKILIPQPKEQTTSIPNSSVVVSLAKDPPLVQQELVSAQLQRNKSSFQIYVLPQPSATHQNSLAAARAEQTHTKPKRCHKWKPSYLIDY